MNNGIITWSRVGNAWGLRVPARFTATTGDEVTVTKKSGEEQKVTLDRVLRTYPEATIYAPGPTTQEEEESDDLTPITGPGAFEFGGEVFIVKPTRDKQRLYAMKVVEAAADRLVESGKGVPIELEYAKGAMRFLREEHRLELERAKELTIRYGRCIVCGAKLKVKASVEAGMGPVCRSRVREGSSK